MDFIYIFDSTNKDKICNMQEPTIYREFGFGNLDFNSSPLNWSLPFLKAWLTQMYTLPTLTEPHLLHKDVIRGERWEKLTAAFVNLKNSFPPVSLSLKETAHHRSPKSPLRLPNLLYYSIGWLSKYHTVT